MENAGRSHGIKIDDSSFESVEEFKYLGTALTKGQGNRGVEKTTKLRAS